MKISIKSLHILMLATLLTACQTTNNEFMTEKEVDINETRIVLPAELYNLKGFKIKKVVVKETGSYRRENVYFTGGGFSYDRYFNGGFKKRNKSHLMKEIESFASNATAIAEVKKEQLPVGDVYYTTYKDTFEEKDITCFIMVGNHGAVVPLRGGPGTAGITMGLYCEPGTVPNMEQRVLKWLKKVKLT